MDGALAFREQMNDFLTKAMEQGPLSARSDTDALAGAIRSLEDRVIGEIVAPSTGQPAQPLVTIATIGQPAVTSSLDYHGEIASGGILVGDIVANIDG